MTLTDKLVKAGVPRDTLALIPADAPEGIYAGCLKRGMSRSRAVVVTAQRILAMVSIKP